MTQRKRGRDGTEEERQTGHEQSEATRTRCELIITDERAGRERLRAEEKKEGRRTIRDHSMEEHVERAGGCRLPERGEKDDVSRRAWVDGPGVTTHWFRRMQGRVCRGKMIVRATEREKRQAGGGEGGVEGRGWGRGR